MSQEKNMVGDNLGVPSVAPKIPNLLIKKWTGIKKLKYFLNEFFEKKTNNYWIFIKIKIILKIDEFYFLSLVATQELLAA